MNLNGQIFRASGTEITIQAAEASQGAKTPRFTMTAYTGAPIRQVFAEEPIVVDLEGMTIPDRAIPIRLGHMSSEGVGHTEAVSVESVEGQLHLVASGVVSRATDAARDVVESGRQGFPWQASIGASIESFEFVKAGATVEVNGRELSGPLVVARRTTLGEISFVDLGADSDTQARIAASQRATDPGAITMDKDNKSGSDTTTSEPSKTTPPTKKIDASGGGAMDDLRAKAQEATINAERQAKIKASAERAMESRPDKAEDILQLAQQAIEDKVDPSDFGVQMLRFAQDFPGIGSPRSGNAAPTNELIEAGILLELGHDEDQIVKSYGEQTVEACRRKFGGGIGINEALSIAANAGGGAFSRIKESNISAALVVAFGTSQIQAASTVSLPNILSNVANKVSEAAFNAVDNSWEKIAGVASLKDFKPNTTNSLVGDYKMKELGKGGEIEHAKPGEETYQMQADTYARQLELTRKDIINDDTGALLEAPQKLGRGGALARNDKFWSVFGDHGSFFAGGNNNLLTGGGSALSISAVTDAMVALMNQTDPQGEPLGLMPGDFLLLCPPALFPTAQQIASSSEIRGASGEFGTANPHQGLFTPIMSPYLTAQSTTAWYLMAKPSVMPTIKMGFLNGKRRPTIETAQADFNTLGIRMRGWIDFGAALWEYRAAVKSAGV